MNHGCNSRKKNNDWRLQLNSAHGKTIWNSIVGCISRNKLNVFRTATARTYVIAQVLQSVCEFGGCQSIVFYKVLVSMGSQSVVVVKDWFVSGCQPIVLVVCLGCVAMLLTNNDKEYYMFQNGQWAMRNPGGKQHLCCAHYSALLTIRRWFVLGCQSIVIVFVKCWCQNTSANRI